MEDVLVFVEEVVGVLVALAAVAMLADLTMEVEVGSLKNLSQCSTSGYSTAQMTWLSVYMYPVHHIQIFIN